MAHKFLLDIPNLPEKPGCTFKIPPLDGSLIIPELFDWHSVNNPTQAVFSYDSADGLEKITFSTIVPAMRKISLHLTSYGAEKNVGTSNAKLPFAILAHADTVSYFSVLVAMMYAGIPVFPISPRLPASDIAHLVDLVNVSHILVSEDLKGLLDAAIDVLKRRRSKEPKMIPMPFYADFLVATSAEGPIPEIEKIDSDIFNDPAIYVHSSGSSSLPKAVPWTHASMLQVSLIPYLGSFDLRAEVFGAHAVPMFHASGLNFISWVASTGFIMALHSPKLPLVIPTPENLLSGLEKSNAAFLICVPSFLEAWVDDPHAINVLKSLKVIAYGGGPLSKATGDRLTTQGVNVITVFGSTEAGVLGSLFCEYQGEDWEYFSINPHCAARFQLREDGFYELIVVKQPTQVLPIINTALEGTEAYATNDLFLPHPVKPGYWKPCGRADDKITLTNGLKINPWPLEVILMEHPLIDSAIIFGTGRFQIGVLLFPSPNFRPNFDARDNNEVSQYLDAIWSQVEQINAHGPRQARLVREMILLRSPDRELLVTNKGTVRRASNIKAYESEIEALYNKYESSVSASVLPSVSSPVWTQQRSLAFVRKTVRDILPGVPNDDSDIFLLGCDSVQATWIRVTITHALQMSGTTAAPPQSFVYNFPTISSLANLMVNISQGTSATASSLQPKDDIRQFISRHAQFEGFTPNSSVHSHKATPVKNYEKDIILLTGSTGALGCHVLTTLLESDSVALIYVLIRPSSAGVSLVERQESSFRKQGICASMAKSPKIKYLEFILKNEELQIDSEVKNEILCAVTHIFHFAWPVNFNMTLSLFDESFRCLKSLINLALMSQLSAPPRFVFAGSIGIFKPASIPGVAMGEKYVDDPCLVSDIGYCQSKWVAEEILRAASSKTRLDPVIVRLGQLSGSTARGAWNPTEWVPAIVKSSMALGFLPNAPGVVSWLPVDIAARAVFELRNAFQPVIHVVHPNPVSYSSVVDNLSDILKLPSRPFAEWITELQARQAEAERQGTTSGPTESIVQTIPALKLIDFLSQLGHEKCTESQEAFSLCEVTAPQGIRLSSSLQGAPRLSREDTLRWVRFWEGANFFRVDTA